MCPAAAAAAEQAAPAQSLAAVHHRQARALLVARADRWSAATGQRERPYRLSRDNLSLRLWPGGSCCWPLSSSAESPPPATTTLQSQASRLIRSGCPLHRTAATRGRRSPDFWPLGSRSADLPP